MEIQQQITLQNYCPHLFSGRWGAGCGGAVLTVTGPQNLTMNYAANGNITGKSDLGTANQFIYGNSARPYRLTGLETNTSLVPVTLQQITYTSFEQPSVITESPFQATFKYNTEGQRASMVVTQNGSAILSRSYVGSRNIKDSNGNEYTWIGGDAYTAPCVVAKTGGTTNWYYVLRDHLGTITHLVFASTNTVAGEYSFDAWGRRRDRDDWSYTLAGDPDLLVNRGFTAHEWLPWFNLYNMNGRLYDPVVGRFLNPDNYVQMPDFSQNFNRYSYCWNNPLRYTDPDGEIIFTLLATFIPGAQFLLPYAIAADISWMTDYAVQVATNYLSNPDGKPGDWFFKDIDIVDLGVSAAAGAASHGLANVKKIKKGHKLVKGAIEYGLPAISARYDWKPFSDDERWKINRGNDFWAPYIFAVVKQGAATRNSDKITEAIYSDKPWLLSDPLKGGLLGTLLDVPASVFTGWLSNKATAPAPIDIPQIPQLPKETPLPPNWWENMNNSVPNKEHIQNSLILNKF